MLERVPGTAVWVQASTLREAKAGTQAGAEAESREESCLLACPPWLSFLAFFEIESYYVSTCSRLGPSLPYQSLIKRMSHYMPERPSDRGHSS